MLHLVYLVRFLEGRGYKKRVICTSNNAFFPLFLFLNHYLKFHFLEILKLFLTEYYVVFIYFFYFFHYVSFKQMSD